MAISIPYGAIKSYLSQIRRFGQNNISIPYGAIKRKMNLLLELTMIISIPYGAIKRFFYSSQVHLLANFNSLWCD